MKLKDLLRELLFKDEFEQTTNELIHLKGQLQMLEATRLKTEQMLTQITGDCHNQIVYYATNKCEEKIFVVKRSHLYNSETFDLYLRCINYSSGVSMLPVVYCSYHNHCSLEGKIPFIRIDDILMKEHLNVGNGTIAIQGLKTVAQHMKVKMICGSLSNVDKERFDMLEHFYLKCGFKVNFNEKRTSGHIELLL